MPLIAAIIFGGVNLFIQSFDKKTQIARRGVKHFLAGALAGMFVGSIIALLVPIPFLLILLKVLLCINAGSAIISILAGLVCGILKSDWQKLINSTKIWVGNFYIDGKGRSFIAQVWQGVSRFTREIFQTTVGHTYCQFKNMFDGIDKVVYFGGVTFTIKESGDGSGISLGNHIQANIQGAYKEVAVDSLLMHEYGHTFDSMLFGLLYLPVPGLASLISASRNGYDAATRLSTHEAFWTEQRADRFAAQYFKKCNDGENTG